MMAASSPSSGSQMSRVSAATVMIAAKTRPTPSAIAPWSRRRLTAGIEHQQRHADRQRQGDQRRRHLEDRRQFAPARGQEFDRDKAGDPGDEQHDDIGERKAAALAAHRKPAEDDPNEGMIAPPVGDRAADERQDRQRQPCDLVGPQEGVVEIDPRQHVGQHQHQFAEQRRHDQAFGGAIDQPKPCQFRASGKAPPREDAICSSTRTVAISTALVLISSQPA